MRYSPHAGGEEHRLLEHDADLVAQGIQRHIAHVNAIQRDATAGDIVKARDQIDDGGFAGTGRAEQRHHLARLRLKIEPIQHDTLIKIGKGDIGKADIPADWRSLRAFDESVTSDCASRMEKMRSPAADAIATAGIITPRRRTGAIS